jgi:hypothetical protein
MTMKRLVTVALALAVSLVGVVPAGAAAADGDDTVDCQYHIPEDPDCDGELEQPGPDEIDQPDRSNSNGGGLVGGIVGAVVGLVGALL